MKIKIIIALALPLLSIWTSSYASPLSPSEAILRVEETGARKVKYASPEPELKGIWNDSSGIPAMYVFTYSGNEGFLIVAADDAVAPLLGYSTSNDFDMQALSPEVTSWLNQYAERIAAARGQESYSPLATRAEMEAVGPLLTTLWDQTMPYNQECPISDGKQCITGCVATAMAQVMNFWKYPVSGTGNIAYSPVTLDQDLYMDFAATEFDWDNMLDKYDRYSSEISKTAVATLMKACGYSVRMNYSPYESGALSRDISTALTTYFNYDRGVSRKERYAYSSQDQWNKLIYDELAAGRPVIYTGASVNGAHCFVCDGYENGYFHINWGWGGMSDGYFLLNELTPHEWGAGGHYGGYNLDQEAVIGIMPPVGRLVLGDMYLSNAADDSGNVKGWGYTYRLNDFSNILLNVELNIYGGHVSSPLYVTVYETNPVTVKNEKLLLDTTFDDPLNASDGTVKRSLLLHIDDFNPSKLYTLTLSYDLKGQKTTIGNLRMAASSGVDDIFAEESQLSLTHDGNSIKASFPMSVTLSLYDAKGTRVAEAAGSNPEISFSGFEKGIYIATAIGEDGAYRTLKLLLK